MSDELNMKSEFETLKNQLKVWEKQFQKDNGRLAGKSDLAKAPEIESKVEKSLEGIQKITSISKQSDAVADLSNNTPAFHPLPLSNFSADIRGSVSSRKKIDINAFKKSLTSQAPQPSYFDNSLKRSNRSDDDLPINAKETDIKPSKIAKKPTQKRQTRRVKRNYCHYYLIIHTILFTPS
ncbi:DNA replication regulator SLD2 [Smittium culicis]|uniref:DNA replication regulator SLD2 n=1 Tax=Smittium culicis TaxID=133412 RepID=A0A1R1Y9W7_9FUNG|nr:DNA replication regulator SLD2 [Smittium culicis]